MTDIARFKLAKASQSWLCDSDLATSIDTYTNCLRDRGYARRTIQAYVKAIAHFAYWCTRRRICIREINEVTVERFLERPLCRGPLPSQGTRHTTGAALKHLLEVLRAQHRIAPKKSSIPTAISNEIHGFEYYLSEVCGLKPVTRDDRLRHVRAFLVDRYRSGSIRMNVLKPVDVIRFMGKYTQRWKASSRRHVGNSLRSYFRFKALQGEDTGRLSAAVPKVAQWRMASLPKGISVDQTNQLLKGFDRNTATGKRDYAITRCFVDLGLRTPEVASLTLDDIDWRQGLMYIRGKGRRVDVLPLPAATGRAIVTYLHQGRPQTNSRALFLRHRPPLHMPATCSIVRAAVRCAARRSGVERCFHGPRVLRHTLAERLVQRATPLKHIADLLRHRSLDTTAIYAKVDLSALSRVALPWPGRQS